MLNTPRTGSIVKRPRRKQNSRDRLSRARQLNERDVRDARAYDRQLGARVYAPDPVPLFSPPPIISEESELSASFGPIPDGPIVAPVWRGPGLAPTFGPSPPRVSASSEPWVVEPVSLDGEPPIVELPEEPWEFQPIGVPLDNPVDLQSADVHMADAEPLAHRPHFDVAALASDTEDDEGARGLSDSDSDDEMLDLVPPETSNYSVVRRVFARAADRTADTSRVDQEATLDALGVLLMELKRMSIAASRVPRPAFVWDESPVPDRPLDERMRDRDIVDVAPIDLVGQLVGSVDPWVGVKYYDLRGVNSLAAHPGSYVFRREPDTGRLRFYNTRPQSQKYLLTEMLSSTPSRNFVVYITRSGHYACEPRGRKSFYFDRAVLEIFLPASQITNFPGLVSSGEDGRGPALPTELMPSRRRAHWYLYYGETPRRAIHVPGQSQLPPAEYVMQLLDNAWSPILSVARFRLSFRPCRNLDVLGEPEPYNAAEHNYLGDAIPDWAYQGLPPSSE